MKKDRPIRLGEVFSLRSTTGNLMTYYKVTGWTQRGKVILTNQESGNDRKGWWTNHSDLPKSIHYEPPVS